MLTNTLRDKNLRLILAVKNKGLPKSLDSTLFLPMPHYQTIETLENAGLWFGPRPVLEETEEFRQIIPYIVLQHNSKFIRYTRTPASSETRLHGRTSLGLGGHVDISDTESLGDVIDLAHTLENAANRELFEELGDVQVISKEWIGLLVDNNSAVGRVHIGVIGLWHLNSIPSGMTEKAIGEVALDSVEGLQANMECLETWSAMLLPWLATVEKKEHIS